MSTSIFLLLFSVTVSIVLFKFGIPTTPTLKPFTQRMLPAFAVVILMLGANILYAFSAKSALQLVIDLPAITNRADLEKAQSGEPIVLEAIASSDNPVKGKNNEYLAYIDEDGLWTPFDILLDLEDTQVEMTNDTYRPRNWIRREDQPKIMTSTKIRSYLLPGDTLTILGEKQVWERAAGEEKGKITHTIEGLIVYNGSHTSFIQNTTRRLWGPRIMAGLSAFALGATVLGVVITAAKLAMTKPA